MKSFWSNATVGGKIVAVLFALAIVGTGIYYAYNWAQKSGKLDEAIQGTMATKIKVNKEADLVIAYNTFAGCAAIVEMNGGMEPNENSRLFKEYGIKLQIKQMDAVSDTRDALKAGIIDAAYCTVDALSTEMSSSSELLDLGIKVRFKVNESRGADAIVGNSSIKSVKDLKGKKIAYAVGTASHTLLLNVLETAGLTMKDIDPVKVADGIEAVASFKSKSSDAAVVWAPDDEDLVASVPGTTIVISTKVATQIIADGLLIGEERLKDKKELFTKLVKAWMVANGELNDNPSARKSALGTFAAGFKFDAGVAQLSGEKIRFCTLGDNKEFFGFDPTFTGITGEKMYSRMAVKYTEAGLAKAPASWSKVSDGSIIESLLGDAAFANSKTQDRATETVFTAPTVADTKKTANSSKVISLTFATGEYELSEQDKNIIDREITALAQSFETARIRVEGNTDNVGNALSNKDLSYKRARSVVNYLNREYKLQINKFIVVGNGQNNPVPGCEDNRDEDCRAKNRRTEFSFIW